MKLFSANLYDETGEFLGLAFIDAETGEISDYTIEEYMESIRQ